MDVRRNHAWVWRKDGRCELYAADFRALSTVAKRARLLRRIGIPPTMMSAIADEIPSLRRRAKVEQAHNCGGARPVLLFLSPAAGAVDDVWLASDTWRELRAKLQEVR